MGKLQYDSFYKFIVSIGILLIVTPFLFLHFWLSGSYDLMISQHEFKNLTEKVAKLVLTKIEYMNILCSILPVMFIITEILGIALFIWGCYKWYSIQKYLDRMSELDVKEKDIRLQQMTPEEKIEKMSKEVKEEKSVQGFKKESTDGDIIRGLKIEQLYCGYLRKKLGNNYILYRNMKIKNYEYDIIAHSRRSNIDIIYEIKYRSKSVSEMLLERTCQRMREAEMEYGNYVHRNKRSIIVIVSNSKIIEQMKQREMDTIVKDKYHIDMEFVEEKDLYSIKA